MALLYADSEDETTDTVLWRSIRCDDLGKCCDSSQIFSIYTQVILRDLYRIILLFQLLKEVAEVVEVIIEGPGLVVKKRWNMTQDIN